MNRIILLPLLLLAQPTFGQSLKERLEAEASTLVADVLSAHCASDTDLRGSRDQVCRVRWTVFR
jgi:hypothetical protein